MDFLSAATHLLDLIVLGDVLRYIMLIMGLFIIFEVVLGRK
jgi:hypothetical protein